MMTSTDIRSDARAHLTNKWGKGALITFCYAIIEYALNLLSSFAENLAVLNLIVSVGTLVISIPISYGLVISFMKLKRYEEVHSFDFLSLGFSSFSRAWKVTFSMLGKLVVPIILSVISCVVLIIAIGFYVVSASDAILSTATSNRSTTEYYEDLEQAQLDLAEAQVNYYKNPSSANRYAVEDAQELVNDIKASRNDSTSSASTSNTNNSSSASIIFLVIGLIAAFASGIYYYTKQLFYVLSFNIAYDEPNLTSKEVVEKSKVLMNGNRGNYFVLTLSFIGWAILSAFTLGIGYFWLLPYMQVSMICFYDRLAN